MSWSYSAVVGTELARPAPVYLGTGPEDIICVESDLGVAFAGPEADMVELSAEQIGLLTHLAANACNAVQFVPGRHKTREALDEARLRIEHLQEKLGPAGHSCIQICDRLTCRGVNTLTRLPGGYLRPVCLTPDVVYFPLNGQLRGPRRNQQLSAAPFRLANFLLAHRTQPLHGKTIAEQIGLRSGIASSMNELRRRLALAGAPDCIQSKQDVGYCLQ